MRDKLGDVEVTVHGVKKPVRALETTELDGLRLMDDPALIEPLYHLGQAAAKHQVNDQYWENIAQLPAPPSQS